MMAQSFIAVSLPSSQSKEGDDVELGMIDSEEEYEIVADAFDELLDNEAYEDM